MPVGILTKGVPFWKLKVQKKHLNYKVLFKE